MYELYNEGDMPISLSALRDHCRIIGDDFDTQLTRAYYAAAYDIERRSGLLLRPCSVRVTLRGGSALRGFVLPVGPVDTTSVALFEADGTTPIAAADTWYVNPNSAEPKIEVLDRSRFEEDLNYVITYDAGLSSIPNDLTVAVLELSAHHFENREATSPVMLHAVPSSVWSIVANYGRGKV